MFLTNQNPPYDQFLDQNQFAKSSNLVTWSIRGMEHGTRTVTEEDAERAAKTIGQYVNDDIPSMLQSQLTHSQLLAFYIDIQNQIDQLTKLVNGIANQMPEQTKKSFWQRLIG